MNYPEERTELPGRKERIARKMAELPVIITGKEIPSV